MSYIGKRGRAIERTSSIGCLHDRRGGECVGGGRRRGLLQELLADVNMAELLGVWHAERRTNGRASGGRRLGATLG